MIVQISTDQMARNASRGTLSRLVNVGVDRIWRRSGGRAEPGSISHPDASLESKQYLTHLRT